MRYVLSTIFGISLSAMGAVSALALDVTGTISDDKGMPLPYVRVRIAHPDSAPYSTSVFTSADGTFAAHDIKGPTNKLDIDIFRIGWKEADRKSEKQGDGLSLTVKMSSIENVADQVPPSAWLGGDPNSTPYMLTTTQCSNCHQIGAKRVRDFSASLADLPVEERSEAWLKRWVEDISKYGDKKFPKDDKNVPEHARVQAWSDMVQYMRYVTMHLGEDNKLRWGLKEGSDAYNALLNPDTSLFQPRDMEIVVPNLAYNFPVKFDTYTNYKDTERLGPYGVTKATVIQEYVLPTFGWTREISIAPGSSLIWFLETDKDRLGSLNPKDGKVTWYPVPAKGQQGPHTMNSDADGNLWVGLEDSFNIGRFNTKTKEWRLYPPPPGKVFGVTHDFAYNSDRHVEKDSHGRIWITDMGTNEFWAINVESGKIDTYQMQLPPGETHFHSLLYGAAIDTKRNRVWFAQLNGYGGSFNSKTNTPEFFIPFGRGEGPRRLAVAEDGTLWMPLFGNGELAKIDPDTGKVVKRYPIPDGGAGPYGVTLDKKRNAVWAATSNSDRIYRFDIAKEKWTHYPLPRQDSYIRMIEIDPATGDVWTTYASLPVGKRDPKYFKTESANNMIVRIIPGD